MRTDVAFEAGPQGWAFDRHTAQRIRTVEHNDGQANGSSGFEAIKHCGRERVVAAADVLQVNHEHVEIGKLFARRLETFDRKTVETVAANAGERVISRGDAD